MISVNWLPRGGVTSWRCVSSQPGVDLFHQRWVFETSPFSDSESFPEGGGTLVVSGAVSRGRLFKSEPRFETSPFSGLQLHFKI